MEHSCKAGLVKCVLRGADFYHLLGRLSVGFLCMENKFYQIPDHLKPKNEGTDPLFRNGFMEKLTRTNIAVPVTMHSIIVVVFGYFAFQQLPWLWGVGLFLSGWMTWSLAEYWLHRSVYHAQTDKKWLLKIQYMGHGIHHQYPKDPTRLAMPPVPALLLLALFYGLFWLFLRDWAIAFFPGFVGGYLLYISIHYAQHRFRTPSFLPFKRLWKYHAMHHYKFPEDKVFGVSTLLWDYVFGTMPDEG